MKKQVKITIKGIQNDDHIEMTTVGTLYKKDNRIFINYIDRLLDDEKETNTTIKIDGNKKVTIIRYGAVTTTMIFEKISYSTYHTPLGVFELEINTNNIFLKDTSDRLELKLNYTLGVNGKQESDAFFELKADKLDI